MKLTSRQMTLVLASMQDRGRNHNTPGQIEELLDEHAQQALVRCLRTFGLDIIDFDFEQQQLLTGEWKTCFWDRSYRNPDNRFTVVLLLPENAAACFGQDIYCTTVEASEVAEAAAIARAALIFHVQGSDLEPQTPAHQVRYRNRRDELEALGNTTSEAQGIISAAARTLGPDDLRVVAVFAGVHNDLLKH